MTEIRPATAIAFRGIHKMLLICLGQLKNLLELFDTLLTEMETEEHEDDGITCYKCDTPIRIDRCTGNSYCPHCNVFTGGIVDMDSMTEEETKEFAKKVSEFLPKDQPSPYSDKGVSTLGPSPHHKGQGGVSSEPAKYPCTVCGLEVEAFNNRCRGCRGWCCETHFNMVHERCSDCAQKENRKDLECSICGYRGPPYNVKKCSECLKPFCFTHLVTGETCAKCSDEHDEDCGHSACHEQKLRSQGVDPHCAACGKINTPYICPKCGRTLCVEHFRVNLGTCNECIEDEPKRRKAVQCFHCGAILVSDRETFHDCQYCKKEVCEKCKSEREWDTCKESKGKPKTDEDDSPPEKTWSCHICKGRFKESQITASRCELCNEKVCPDCISKVDDQDRAWCEQCEGEAS